MADPSVWTDAVAGPASYSAANGIVITTSLATVAFARVSLDVEGANLGRVEFDVVRNSPAAGQFTVRPKRRQYDRLTATGALSGLPAGVTGRATSGGTVDASTHTHATDHDHGSFSSAGPTGGTVASLNAVGNNVTTHTHTLDLANLAGTSGADVTHVHTWDSLYAHGHAITNTQTDGTLVEVPNATDLSGATLNYLATAG